MVKKKLPALIKKSDKSECQILSEIVELFQQGLKARKTEIWDLRFLTKKTPKENVGKFVFNTFLLSLEKICLLDRIFVL